MEWQDISTAPKSGRIDIWAKRWDVSTDTFRGERFTDCIWYAGDSMTNSPACWAGVNREWRATHWMPLPEPPK